MIDLLERLTVREREVFKARAQGKSFPVIGKELRISGGSAWNLFAIARKKLQHGKRFERTVADVKP